MMVCLTIWRITAISGLKMKNAQPNLIISGSIIPG